VASGLDYVEQPGGLNLLMPPTRSSALANAIGRGEGSNPTPGSSDRSRFSSARATAATRTTQRCWCVESVQGTVERAALGEERETGVPGEARSGRWRTPTRGAPTRAMICWENPGASPSHHKRSTTFSWRWINLGRPAPSAKVGRVRLWGPEKSRCEGPEHRAGAARHGRHVLQPGASFPAPGHRGPRDQGGR